MGFFRYVYQGIEFLFISSLLKVVFVVVVIVFKSGIDVKFCQIILLHLLRWSYVFSIVVYYYGELHWFFNVKPTPHFFGGPHLVMIYYYFVEFAFIIVFIIVVYVHEGYWTIIIFCLILLSGKCSPHRISWGVFSLLQCFWIVWNFS